MELLVLLLCLLLIFKACALVEQRVEFIEDEGKKERVSEILVTLIPPVTLIMTLILLVTLETILPIVKLKTCNL